MPKSYFQLQNCTSLSQLKPRAKIHIIAVCGVAMGQLAVALQKQGFQVSGSDKAFYEPMGSYLRSHQLVLFEGYETANIQEDYDLVVIGNAVSYEHPEVLETERLKLAYTCFPKILAELVIADKKSIVVTGTHGKTTTSSLIAQCLEKLSPNPSYFIGGVVNSLESSLEARQGRFSVVEGDEYDTAFFAKVPKFSFYPADILVINAIEFDHADIYQSLEVINQEFENKVLSQSKESLILACLDFGNLKKQLSRWKEIWSGKIITFGQDPEADCQIMEISYLHGQQKVVFNFEGQVRELFSPLRGSYNARNILASALALEKSGFGWKEISEALQGIEAPKRRQEKFLANQEQIFIEDFAHHPTAVKETISSFKELYPEMPIWAVFEPASNTSRRKIMQEDYRQSFALADSILIMEPSAKGNIAGELLNTEELCRSLKSLKKIAETFGDSERMLDFLIKNLPSKAVVILMSNSSFDGLKDKIIKHYSKQQ